MTRRCHAIVLLAFLLALPAARLSAQRPTVCGDDRKRETIRGLLDRMMRSDDSTARSSRRTLRLPRVHPDSVIYVDDPRVCERAANVYYRDQLGPRPLHGVAVARVRDLYVVYGYIRAGEWVPLVVYNSAFETLAGILM